MIKMFEKNDRTIKFFIIASVIGSVLFAICGVVIGIVLCVNNWYWIGVPCMIALPLFSWLLWFIARFAITVACDIKLIRNKLYCNDNENLVGLLEGREKATSESIVSKQENKFDYIVVKIKELKREYDDGKITQEEYEARKSELLDN